MGSENQEKCWCVSYYSHSAEKYVYVVEDIRRYWGERYYKYEDDIPKRLLLTRDEALRLERLLDSRYDEVRISKVLL